VSFIETDRLLIRKWDIARDLDDAVAIYGDAETMRFIPCGALTREQTQRFIERMMQRDEENGFGIWPVVLKANQRVIGECGVTYIPEHGQDVEIAWIYNRDYHRQGYATEAARAVLDFAFRDLKLPQVYALIARENAASIGVANRLDMDYDRIIRAYKRDLMRYKKVNPVIEPE
jgi:RimJ/RimL family protein N-acetyltransferase